MRGVIAQLPHTKFNPGVRKIITSAEGIDRLQTDFSDIHNGPRQHPDLNIPPNLVHYHCQLCCVLSLSSLGPVHHVSYSPLENHNL